MARCANGNQAVSIEIRRQIGGDDIERCCGGFLEYLLAPLPVARTSGACRNARRRIFIARPSASRGGRRDVMSSRIAASSSRSARVSDLNLLSSSCPILRLSSAALVVEYPDPVALPHRRAGRDEAGAAAVDPLGDH